MADLTAKTADGAPKANGGGKQYHVSAESEKSPKLHTGKGDVIPLYRNCPALLYGDWLWRFWVYFDRPSSWISWYAAAGFFFGGTCFIIGAFTSVSPAIYNQEVIGNCMGDIMDWTVNFMYLLGNTFWQVAVVFQMIEALNPAYDTSVYDWEVSNKQGPKPRYRWIGVRFSLDWFGALSYTVGVAMYWTAALATILNDCPDTLLATDVYLWLIDYFYIIAGWLFALAGLLYTMAEISIWVIPGILCPFNRKDALSLKWWAMWMYFWGGIGFAMGGMQLEWFSPVNVVETQAQYNIVTGIGFGGGSILFTVGAAMFLARQARGRCRPSYAVVGRLDATIHTGPHFSNGKASGEDKV